MNAVRNGARVPLGGIVLGVAVLASCASSGGVADAETGSLAAPESSRKTQQQVQSELMAFADRFFASTLESAKILEAALETPESRYTAAGARLVALTVTTDIAASPNPGAALLDMTVYVTLKRMVWRDYWMPEVYGETGRPVLDNLIEIEDDIWSIAAEVYTPDQLDELRELIDDWRAQHPDAVSVDFVRLAEIGDARRVQNLMDASRPGGMLAPVKEANRSLEEMRLLAERLVFMATRMQLTTSLQVEMASAKLATQPEVRQLLEDSTNFTAATDRAAEAFAILAADLPEERRAAIDQMLQGLSAERERLFADLAADDGDFQGALADFRQTLEAGRRMAEALDEAIRSADRLVERSIEGNKSAARPFDILDYHVTLSEATVAAQEIRETLAALEHILGSALTDEQLNSLLEGANRIEEEVIDDVIDRAFLRGVALIIVFFVVLTFYRWLTGRLFPGPSSRPEGDR